MKIKILNNKNKFYVTLLVSIVVISVQWLLMKDIKTNGIWEWIITSFFLFFILPVLIIKFYFKENLSSFHLSFDFKLKETLITLISGIIFIGIFWLLMIKFNWYKEFSASNLMFGGRDLFLFFEFLILPFILFFQEFFFRGFLLRSAEKAIGVIGAILIQVLIVLVFEYILGASLNFIIFFSILIVNLFLGWLIFQTRTILLTSIVSWLINIVINFTVFYYLNIS